MNELLPFSYLNEIIYKNDNLKMKLIDVNGIEIECSVKDIQISMSLTEPVELSITAIWNGRFANEKR